MHIASNLYIKMAVPGWPFSCSTGIKVTSARASQPGSCDQALTVSFTVTQFARESSGICHFRGSCTRENDLDPVYMKWGTPVPCVSCGTYCNAHKCCVVTHRAADIDLNSCLRSHVLRAHCNFESKQANLITLFGRRPNNNRTNLLGEK